MADPLLLEVLNRVAAALERPGYYVPIETAPRFGPILLFDCSMADDEPPVVCQWDDMAAKWFVVWNGEEYLDPTHWAPLPKMMAA